MANSGADTTEIVTLRTGDGELEVSTLTELDAVIYACTMNDNALDSKLREYLAGWADQYFIPDEVAARIDDARRGDGLIFGIWAGTDDNRRFVGSYEYWQRQPGIYFANVWIDQAWRRKGIAERAGALLTMHMFDTVKARALRAEIEKTNIPSQRVAERLGRQVLRAPGGLNNYATYEISHERYREMHDLFVVAAR